MPGYGYTSFIGLAIETVWGTKVAPATLFLDPVRGGDRLQSNEPLIISAGVNDISTHKGRKVRRGGIECGGEVEFELPYQGAETWLKYAFGKAVSAVDSAGPEYNHTFTIDPASWLALVGLSVESKRDHASANSFFYEGCVFTFIEFALTVDGFWMVTIGVAAEDVSMASSSTAVLPTAPLANFYDGGTGSTVTWNSAAAEITDFRVRLEQNYNVSRRGAFARTIKKPTYGGKINVTGSFRSTFESSAHFDDFRAAQERALIVKSVGDALTNGGYEFTVNVPVAVITPTGEPQVSDEGIIYADLPFQGFYDGTDRELNVVLRNLATTVT